MADTNVPAHLGGLDKTVSKKSCPKGWTERNSHCYKLTRNKASWTEANQQCKKLGALLASVQDAAENKLIASLITNAPQGKLPLVWIGLSRNAGQMQWADGSRLSYTNWASGEPSIITLREDCVGMYSKNQPKMTSYDEKKTLPPAEVLPGGVFPDEIAAIKKRVRGENMSRLKIGIAVGSVVLVILAVVGGTLLGLHLNRKPNVVVRSVQLTIENEIMEETVEVDKEKDTETFRTVSSTGTSFVIRDMSNSLSAYRFDGDEKCYVLYESLEEAEDTAELLEDLEQMEEGEVDAAVRRPGAFLSVDESRGQVDRSVLSESMLEFCEGLRTHWAVKSSTEPTPTPGATMEDEGEEAEEEADPEMEVPTGTNAFPYCVSL
uniref:C-type lectin domain-containing protein n=1 Tax=Branchiostoma floridae TaxID=7739 RepID=C3YCX8_BRAFL|eukprot:XP_002605919.1 hypothetical protein BRAFLDRAFT_87407 [Branchiostoma floridae]